MDPEAPASGQLERPLLMQTFVFIATRIVFTTLHRMVYPFLPIFAEGLGVNFSQMALAVSARSASGMLGPFLATIADIRGRKAGMLLGSGLFITAVLLPLIWPTFPVFVLMLVLGTVGFLVFLPSMQAYIGDRVQYRQRGRVLGLTELSWSLSFILGMPLVRILVGKWGWKGPLPLLAFLAFCGLVALYWILPKDQAHGSARPAWWKNLRLVLTTPMALCGLGMGILFSLSNELVNLVFSVWLGDSFHFSVGALAQVAMAIGITELVGEALSALLADRLGKILAIVLGLLLNSGAALVLAFLAHNPLTAMLGLLAFYLAFEFLIVSSLPLMSEIMPAARATLMAVNISLISLGRSGADLLAPSLYTWSQQVMPGLGLTNVGANALAAALLNLLALGLLMGLRRVEA